MTTATAPLRVMDSLRDYALVVSELSKPFARNSEVLQGLGISAQEFERARLRWIAVLKADPIARAEFTRAFRGAPELSTDVTLPLGVRVSAAPLPFVDGHFRPEPVAPAAQRADRARVGASSPSDETDSTMLGGGPTGAALPFKRK